MHAIEYTDGPVYIVVSVCVCVCVCVIICVHSVQMVAKGKDCSDLFPAVVKNVVSKNSEVYAC